MSKRQFPNGWVLRRDGFQPSDEKKAWKSVAIHEAAHAVVAEVCGAKVQRVVLKTRVEGFAEASYRRRRGKCDPVVRGVVSLAGHEAEVRFMGRPKTTLPKGDYEAVLDLGCSGDSVNALAQISRRMVRWYAPQIKRVARVLLQRKTLNRRAFLAAFRPPTEPEA